MATLLKVLNNLADIKSAGGVALRVRTQALPLNGDLVWRSHCPRLSSNSFGAFATFRLRASKRGPRVTLPSQGPVRKTQISASITIQKTAGSLDENFLRARRSVRSCHVRPSLGLALEFSRRFPGRRLIGKRARCLWHQTRRSLTRFGPLSPRTAGMCGAPVEPQARARWWNSL